MDCDNVTLDFARVEDAIPLARMSRDLIETGLVWSYRPGRIAGLIGDPDAVVLVARVEALRVGFAIMTFGEQRSHLVLLAVAPTHQRRGIARRLVSWLTESARVAGMASIHVELRADNAAAHALYRSLGFAETFRVTGYYQGREGAVKMVHMLQHKAS